VQPLIEVGCDPLRCPRAGAMPEVADGLADAFRVVAAPNVIGGQGERTGLVQLTAGCQRPRLLDGHDRGLFGAAGRCFCLIEGLDGDLRQPEPGRGNCPVAGDLGGVELENLWPDRIGAGARVGVPLGAVDDLERGPVTEVAQGDTFEGR